VSAERKRGESVAPFFAGLYDTLAANGAELCVGREEYVRHESERVGRGVGPSTELRIVGALGSGGKLWCRSYSRTFFVNGYSEDATPKSDALELRINTALRDFSAAWEGVTPWR
jgi:hypothetical protein